METEMIVRTLTWIIVGGLVIAGVVLMLKKIGVI